MGKKPRRSFSRRISWSFLGMGGITLFLVVFTLFQIGLIIKVGLQSARVFQPSQFYLSTVMSGLEQSYTHAQEYVYQGIGSDSEYDEIWTKQINPYLDSLKITNPKLEVSDQAILSEVFHQIESYDSLNREIRSIMLSSNLGKLKMSLGDIRMQVNELIQQIYSHRIRDYGRFFQYVKVFKASEAVAIILASILGFLLYRGVKRKINHSVKDIQEAMGIFGEGNLPKKISSREDELDEVRQEISELSKQLGQIKNFAQAVGTGEYDADIQVFGNAGEIGTSLGEMRERLQVISKEREVRQWHNVGLTKFSELLNEHSSSLEGMTNAIISPLTEYVNAKQGGLYIKKDIQGAQVMSLMASYAFDKEHHKQGSFSKKEGLLGQAWHLKRSLYFHKLPKNYVQIHSGLGAGVPASLFIFPLISNEETFGMIELASFQPFTQEQRSFLEQVSQLIASAILSVQSNQNTNALLKESQIMTQQMQAQEEEMRQNMEELHATQEEIERHAEQNKAFIDALDRGLAIMTFDHSFRIVDANAKFAALAKSSKEVLIGQKVDIFTSENSQAIDYETLWKHIEEHGSLEKIDNRLNSQQQEVAIQVKYLGIFGIGKELEKILCIVNESPRSMHLN